MRKSLSARLVPWLVAATCVVAPPAFGQQGLGKALDSVNAAADASRQKAPTISTGKVTFDQATRTLTMSDIVIQGDTAWVLKIGQLTSTGLNQAGNNRVTADKVEILDLEISSALPAEMGARIAYKAPKIDIVGYAGPASLVPAANATTPLEVARWWLEQFASISVTSASMPTLTGGLEPDPGKPPVSASFTYVNSTMTNLRGGKLANMAVDRVEFTIQDPTSPLGKMTGLVGKSTAKDIDVSVALTLLDEQKAAADSSRRIIYGEATADSYKISFEGAGSVDLGGMVIANVGVVPSKIKLSKLAAIGSQPPGAVPTPDQLKDMFEGIAELYEGIFMDKFEMRGLSFAFGPQTGKMASMKVNNYSKGKLGEFSVDGLDVPAPDGPVKVDRFALKALDIVGLIRFSAETAMKGEKPGPEAIASLMSAIEGIEIKGLVAPYQKTRQTVNIELASLDWGQFVGPIPTKARAIVRMSGPVDLLDKEPFSLLAAAGFTTASINFDLGTNWTEATKVFDLAPAMAEVGRVGALAAKLSLGNVPKEAYAVDPNMVMMAAQQIEAGPLEIVLRDNGGLELALAKMAKDMGTTPALAQQMLIAQANEMGTAFAALDPQLKAVVDAVKSFLGTPKSTFTLKVTPKAKVAVMELMMAAQTDPASALSKLRIEAATTR